MKIETEIAAMRAQISESPCGYYPERESRNHFVSDPQHHFTVSEITRLLGKGYRRYGTDYYRAYCRSCSECTPYRVVLAEFNPGRSFRRILKRNAGLTVSWGEPRPTQEKFELYVRYQKERHKDFEGMSSLEIRKNLATAMVRQMFTNPASTLELTIKDGDQLLGFAIFDRTEDSLSAVYSVFDAEATERSLGTLNILLGVEHAKTLGLPYLNLGLYLAGHEKMNYKAKFGPAEIYRRFGWIGTGN